MQKKLSYAKKLQKDTAKTRVEKLQSNINIDGSDEKDNTSAGGKRESESSEHWW